MKSPKRLPMQVRGWMSGILVLAVLAGCDESPTLPGGDLLEGGAGEMAASQAVGASWSLISGTEDVHLRTLDALSGGVRKAAAERRMIESGTMVAEAEYARRAGEVEVARTFERAAARGYLGAAIELFGPALVSEAIGGAETALARVESAVRERPASRRTTDVVNRARRGIEQARTDLFQGDSVAALEAAIGAAEAIRELNPEARARAAVAAAVALLDRAIDLAGPDPREEIVVALRDAKDHCDAAKRALDAKEWEVAVTEAKECWEIAHRVIALLSGGVRDDGLEERAQEMVAQAAAVYEEAVGVAGNNPSPEVQRALDHAHDLLEKAREALGAGDFREAIRLARESASLSKRIIDALAGGGRPGPGEVTILPYPYPIRTS